MGPRFVLNVMRVFKGSFGGPTLYKNKDFVSPALKRKEAMLQEQADTERKMQDKENKMKKMKESATLPKDAALEIFE